MIKLMPVLLEWTNHALVFSLLLEKKPVQTFVPDSYSSWVIQRSIDLCLSLRCRSQWAAGPHTIPHLLYHNEGDTMSCFDGRHCIYLPMMAVTSTTNYTRVRLSLAALYFNSSSTTFIVFPLINSVLQWHYFMFSLSHHSWTYLALCFHMNLSGAWWKCGSRWLLLELTGGRACPSGFSSTSHYVSWQADWQQPARKSPSNWNFTAVWT